MTERTMLMELRKRLLGKVTKCSQVKVNVEGFYSFNVFRGEHVTSVEAVIGRNESGSFDRFTDVYTHIYTYNEDDLEHDSMGDAFAYLTSDPDLKV